MNIQKRHTLKSFCNYIFESIINKKFLNKKNLKLLDIGSGKGNHLVGFSRKNIECFGIDKKRGVYKYK